ncbi:MAG: response regulator [Oryzomonas sp.]|uniref:response regulator n=1 Tax=Oryzomonas sp. TaxID=2855186 RepID=UPI002850DFB8|nr:response regulator [Oryzomonas sp.]MDR3578328.1 response regulator [Oryzomonas sp.]
MARAIEQHDHQRGTSQRTILPSVLIVDDEAAILFAYRRLIEKDGVAVDTCETLAGAIEHIESKTYMAIIVDLRLEGTDNDDGRKILEYARQLVPATPVIVITGYGTKESKSAVRAMGAAYYFEKPVEPRIILESIRDIRSNRSGTTRSDE